VVGHTLWGATLAHQPVLAVTVMILLTAVHFVFDRRRLIENSSFDSALTESLASPLRETPSNINALLGRSRHTWTSINCAA